jgi:hypothetical protein
VVNSTCVRPLLERHYVDDLSSFISDCDCPAGAVAALMQRPAGVPLPSCRQPPARSKQIDTLFFPDKAVPRAKITVVAGHLNLQGFSTQTPV